MPIDSRERIGPAVAAVVTDVGHESAPTARRYLAALNAQDHPACNRILCDLAADRDGQMIPTFMAMTQQCLDFAHVLDEFGLLEGGLQTYLDQSALRQLDVVEADQRVLGEDDAI